MRALYGQAAALPASLFELGISPQINASILISMVLSMPDIKVGGRFESCVARVSNNSMFRNGTSRLRPGTRRTLGVKRCMPVLAPRGRHLQAPPFSALCFVIHWG
jgi:hypothetical protein